ncbi:unnamed protein product [Soboliphyme baturini]|uniref:PRK domain-containing protein n=1 Tax=Soboliphyme baturini TaxID=241478 RepID=A0A183IQ58_9BILA|nr:unnamed protein product [Soboliphyme baturini]
MSQATASITGPYVIGIGGATCTGKTTIAEKVSKQLMKHGANVQVFNQDEYYQQDLDSLFIPSLNYWNFDSPQAVDFERLVRDGNLIFESEALDALFDDRYFIKTTYLFCKCIREDRTYIPSDVAGYFDSFVWPAYARMADEAECRPQDFVFLRSFDIRMNVETIFSRTLRYVTDCWIELTCDQLSIDRATSFVLMPECGAISCFVGERFHLCISCQVSHV